ncbi:MAG: hypothetical protein Q8S73_38895 [Deltaproteobacteria bacterium]|nr:hypothetical protein [Myxococcales bacterium]MDP3220134.1 hypothetical protein [Deltaproteobacteria bacterium]
MSHRDERPAGATTVTLDDLDLAVAPRPAAPVAPPCMGECIDDRHPTLSGRARVRWTDPSGAPRDRWLPTLLGVAVRAGDRVLLVSLAHEPDPVVTGVIDGFATRPDAAATGPVVELAAGESLRVVAADGAALVELRQSPDGPVVRLLSTDAAIELPGRLRLTADAIALHARRGGVEVTASDDVAVQGEAIRLNSPPR